jgi:hypothetical protein
MNMQFDQATLAMKANLESRYDSVELLGSGRAKFLRICKGSRRAVTSVDEEGWLVELWSADDPGSREETMVKDEIVETEEEAMQRIRGWLDA